MHSSPSSSTFLGTGSARRDAGPTLGLHPTRIGNDGPRTGSSFPASGRIRRALGPACLLLFYAAAAGISSGRTNGQANANPIPRNGPACLADAVVDSGGSGDFRTVTEALASLPMYTYRRTVIFIRNGTYSEKIRIDADYVTLRGESRDRTILRYSQSRPDWDSRKDWIGPAVVNIHGDDVMLQHLTVENSQPDTNVHAFAVQGDGTRAVFVDCRLLSRGGDTVALWDYRGGMSYFSGCDFRGAVDMMCPRGWCFIRDSRFTEMRQSAALWHAGSYDPDQKLVVRNCSFEGVPGFWLGRRHYPAQFYLIDCLFSRAMADRPVFLVTYPDSSKNNPDFGGNRVYFHGCTREGGNFAWIADNLSEAAGNPADRDVTPAWTFGGRWDPESTAPVEATGITIRDSSAILEFGDIVTVRGAPILRTALGKRLRVPPHRPNDVARLEFRSDAGLLKADFTGDLTVEGGTILASIASATERKLGPVFRIRSCAACHGGQ
jgi:pectinesterase